MSTASRTGTQARERERDGEMERGRAHPDNEHILKNKKQCGSADGHSVLVKVVKTPPNCEKSEK